jgi:hypothetical protein
MGKTQVPSYNKIINTLKSNQDLIVFILSKYGGIMEEKLLNYIANEYKQNQQIIEQIKGRK